MKAINSRSAALYSLLAMAIFVAEHRHVATVRAQAIPQASAWSLFRQLVPSPNADPSWIGWCALTNSPSGLSSISAPCTAPPQTLARGMMNARVSAQQIKLNILRNLVTVPERTSPQAHLIAHFTPVTSPADPTVVSEVLFNSQAAQGLAAIGANSSTYISAGLAAYLTGHQNTLGSTVFPPGSMIVKTIWGLVHDAPYSAANMPIAVGLKPSGFTVLVDPTDPTNKTCKSNIGGSLGQRLSIGCFYNQLIQQTDIDHLGSKAVLTLPKGAATPPYFLFLLGFNVMVKTGSSWNWYTFWWDASKVSNSGASAGFAQQHTAGNTLSSGPFYYFAADHIPGPAAAVYNPYLESFATGSNCVSCHQNACFHRLDEAAVHTDFENDSSPAPSSPPSCSAANSGTYTDFIWDLADSNDTMLHIPAASAPHH
jgi:hypothetical protein